MKFYYLTLTIIKMSHQLKLYSTQINEYMFTRDANKIHQQQQVGFYVHVMFSHFPYTIFVTNLWLPEYNKSRSYPLKNIVIVQKILKQDISWFKCNKVFLNFLRLFYAFRQAFRAVLVHSSIIKCNVYIVTLQMI